MKVEYLEKSTLIIKGLPGNLGFYRDERCWSVFVEFGEYGDSSVFGFGGLVYPNPKP